jgi:hypothetical protein
MAELSREGDRRLCRSHQMAWLMEDPSALIALLTCTESMGLPQWYRGHAFDLCQYAKCLFE